MGSAATLDIKIEEVKKHFVLIDDDIWRITKKGFKKVECITNNKRNYCKIRMAGKTYCHHRIYWCLHTNSNVPTDMEVDHIDGNRINNHWWNLRLCTSRENSQNKVAHRNGKKTGYYKPTDKNKVCSRIYINGDCICLGNYKTKEEAINIYNKASKSLHLYDGNIKQFRELIGCDYKPKGCSFFKRQNIWESYIQINRKRVRLGCYKTEQEANKIYLKAVELKDKYTGDNKAFRTLVKESII
jgi:hypothetical protein